jgi:hypothetical protein
LFDFLAAQQSKPTRKLEISAPNLVLVVNELEEQEFSLKKNAYSGLFGIVFVCLDFS